MSRWICVRKTAEQSDAETLIALPDPQNGESVRFLLQNTESLLQVERIQPEGLHSWLINEHVQRDGSLYLMAPVDPLFIALPLLDAACHDYTKFVTLQDVFYGQSTFPSLHRLLNLEDALIKRLHLLCDTQDLAGGDVQVFRVNEEKTLAFLMRKVEKLVNNPRTLDSFIGRNSHNMDEKGDLRLAACILVKEYLNEKWSAKLESSVLGAPQSGRNENLGNVGFQIDYTLHSRGPNRADAVGKELSKAAKKSKLSVAQRRLEKADKSGMKPIASFFAAQKNKGDKENQP